MAQPVAHDLCKLARIAAAQLRLSLLQTLAPTVHAGLAIRMQRLLHLLHVSLAGHRAQPLTRLLDWQRHPEAVSELEQHDFPLDAENDSPLTGYHPARPMPAIHDGNADGQPHAVQATRRGLTKSTSRSLELETWGRLTQSFAADRLSQTVGTTTRVAAAAVPPARS